jgi:hypothetical protein
MKAGIVVRRLLLGACVALLAACASAPVAMRQRLDTRTGLTVNALANPLELLAPTYGGNRPAIFAYMGPFDINHMGAHSQFLWALVPNDLPATPPAIQCDGRAMDLSVQSNALDTLDLSQPPYEPAYPWSRQWYYVLSEDALECFAQAKMIDLQVSGTGAEATRFTAESPKPTGGFAVFQNFVAHRND